METQTETVALVRSDLPVPLIEGIVSHVAQYLEREAHAHLPVRDSTYVHIQIEKEIKG